MSADDRTDSRHSPKRGLGRGLGALLGEVRREEPLVTPNAGRESEASAPTQRDDGFASLAVAAIEPHPGATSWSLENAAGAPPRRRNSMRFRHSSATLKIAT